jgi:hypothetical protein
VAGRAEIWQTLHATLEVLWDPIGQGAAEDGSNGLATAQGILTAGDITLPTGNLVQGAYDALGNYYAIPEWVVCNPLNMLDDAEANALSADDRDAKADLTGGEETAEELDDEASRRREEKGKAVANTQDLISVQARISETSQDVTVGIVKGENVRSVARKVQEEANVCIYHSCPSQFPLIHLKCEMNIN